MIWPRNTWVLHSFLTDTLGWSNRKCLLGKLHWKLPVLLLDSPEEEKQPLKPLLGVNVSFEIWERLRHFSTWYFKVFRTYFSFRNFIFQFSHVFILQASLMPAAKSTVPIEEYLFATPITIFSNFTASETFLKIVSHLTLILKITMANYSLVVVMHYILTRI